MNQRNGSEKGRRSRSRIVSLLLVVCLLLGGCASQGGKGDDGSVGTGTEGTGEGESGQNGSGGSGNTGDGATYGRYAEEEIPMPEAVTNGRTYGTMLDQEERVVIYGTNKDGSTMMKYVLQPDDTWKEEHEEWMDQNGWGDNLFLSGVSTDGKGNLYVVGQESVDNWKKTIIHIYRLKPGETELEELSFEGLNEEGKLPIYSVCVDDSGEKAILLPSAYPSNISVHKIADGQQVFECESLGGSIWYGNQLLQKSNGGDKLLFKNGDSGELENSIMITETEAGENTFSDGGAIYAKSGEGVWLAREEGLMYHADGGSKWEILLEGDLSVMGMPSYNMSTLMKTSDDVFYLNYSNSNGVVGMVKIRYRDDVVTQPSRTLSIYSLEENFSIRQAIVEFQRENLDVKVDYRAVMSENTSATKEDCIQALNTELLAGKGADLIITDGLPLDAYVEKGVLEDLSGLAADLVKDGSIAGNIVETAKQDGSVYSIPTRWGFAGLIGSERARAAAGSLEELARASEQAEEPFFGKENVDYMEFFDMIYRVYGDELLADGQVSQEAIAAFLESYLKLAKQSAFTSEKTREEGNNLEMSMYNTICGKNGELGYVELTQPFEWMLPAEAMKQSGYSCSNIRNAYFPHVRVAVNRSSENKDIAEEFVRKLLSVSIQAENLDGFPVNPDALEVVVNTRDDDVMIGITYKDDEGNDTLSLSAAWPTEDQMRLVLDNLTVFDKLLEPDETVQAMFVTEIPALWKGEKDVNTAAAALYQKIKTYLAE